MRILTTLLATLMLATTALSDPTPQVVDGTGDVIVDPEHYEVGLSDPGIDVLAIWFTEDAGELVTTIQLTDVDYRPPQWEAYLYDVTIATDAHDSVHIAGTHSKARGWSAFVICHGESETECFQDLAPPTVDPAQNTVTIRAPVSLIGRCAFAPGGWVSAVYSRPLDMRPNFGFQDRAPDEGTGADYCPA